MHDPVVAGIAFEKRYKRVVDRSERTRGVQVHNVFLLKRLRIESVNWMGRFAAIWRVVA